MDRTLLCIVEGRNGDWRGICLDLDIAVQGGSFGEVKRMLEDAIRTYVDDALRETDETTRRRLLDRRVPAWVHLRYLARFFVHGLRHALRTKRHGDGLHGSFEVPCHA